MAPHGIWPLEPCALADRWKTQLATDKWREKKHLNSLYKIELGVAGNFIYGGVFEYDRLDVQQKCHFLSKCMLNRTVRVFPNLSLSHETAIACGTFSNSQF